MNYFPITNSITSLLIDTARAEDKPTATEHSFFPAMFNPLSTTYTFFSFVVLLSPLPHNYAMET